MQDRNIGRLLLTLQLILLCQIWWHMEVCHAEAYPAFSLRVSDFARGTSKNRFHSICDHPVHSWMCTTSFGKSLRSNQRLNIANNNQSQISFRTPKSVTPSTLVVTLPPHYLTRAETPKSSSNSSNLDSLQMQILPSKYSYEVDPSYDMCSHPFHAWLCDRTTQRGRSESFFTTTKPSVQQSKEPLLVTTLEPPTTQLSREPFPNDLPKKDQKEVKKDAFNLSKPLSANNNYQIQKFVSSPSIALNYDSCNHPFHSWLCYNNAKSESKVRQNVISPKDTKDPKPRLPKHDLIILPIKNSNTEKNSINRCTHAFHSWICRSSTTIPLARPVAKSLLTDTQIVHQQKLPNETLVPIKSTTNICNHAFHSWLCPKIPQKVPVKSIRTTTLKPKLNKSLLSNGSDNFMTADPIPVSTPDINKCNHAFHSWLCPKTSQPIHVNSKPSNQGRNIIIKISKMVSPSQQPRTVTTSKPSALKTNDQCNHAFHSWLCPKPKSKEPKSLVITTPSPRLNKNLRPDSLAANDSQKCTHAFHSWLCATTRKPPTTLKLTTAINTPVHKQEKSLISKSSVNIATVAPSSIKTFIPSPKNDYHKCNHAFHSWLCVTPKRVVTTPIPKLEKSLISLNSHNAPVTPFTTPRPLNSNNHNCNHAFHSWLCNEPSKTKIIVSGEEKPNSEPKQFQQISNVGLPKSIINSFKNKYIDCNDPKATNNPLFSSNCQTTPAPLTSTEKTVTTTDKITFNGKSFDITVENNFFKTSTLPTTTVKIPQRNSWEGTNPCTHAFHAWLCQPLRPKLTQPPFSPPRHSPNFVFNHFKNSGKTLDPTQRPAKLVSSIKPAQSELRNFPTKNEKKQDDDNCSHAFHSFLCNKTYPKIAALPTAIKPKPEIPVAKTFLESRSSDGQTVSKADDPCSHPFHSWLCFTIDNRKSTLSLSQIPNIMSLPLENEKPNFKVDDSPRNTRRIKTSDQNLLIDHKYPDDAGAKGQDEGSYETIPIAEDEIVSESKLFDNSDFKLESFFDIAEDELTPQPSSRASKGHVNPLSPIFNRNPKESFIKETVQNIDFSTRKIKLEGLSFTVPTFVQRNLPIYSDLSDPMLFESKRTIPRKISK